MFFSLFFAYRRIFGLRKEKRFLYMEYEESKNGRSRLKAKRFFFLFGSWLYEE
jgi:hypothetical protein